MVGALLDPDPDVHAEEDRLAKGSHPPSVPDGSVVLFLTEGGDSRRHRQAEAEPLLLPSLGNGTVEKITSTGISKYSAIRSARYKLGLYSPRSRYPIVW